MSPTYGGIFVHRIKGKSEYCNGPNCIWPCSKNAREWKGYGAVEIFDEVTKLWLPHCLELTQALELDFRGRWARGGYWLLHWPHKVKKQWPAKTAVFQRSLPLETISPEFAYRPCLLNMYRVFELDLTQKNPLPPRILVSAATGFDPTAKAADQEAAPTEQQWEELRRKRLEWGQLGAMPDKPKANGKPH